MKSFRYLLQARFLLTAALMLIAASSYSTARGQSPPNIEVDAKLSMDRVKRGRTVQGTVTMNIPSGYHVNSNRPLEKFLIATQVQLAGAGGVRAVRINYPRAVIRSLKFSKNKVAVFEGRTTINFAVTVPATFSGDSVELKGRLRYQSCSDDVCFPPRNHDFTLWLKIE